MYWLKLLIGGFAKMFFPYKIPRRKPKTVASALRSDWRKIGNDFGRVIRRG